ncbi:MAG: hypothetical protein R3C51_12990 [Parvularculaceae bacterium]
MERRLDAAGVRNMAGLLATQPKQLRALWGNVNGERMWYALHGYDIPGAGRPGAAACMGMRGCRPNGGGSTRRADCARLLLSKAARRMRRDRFYANRLWVWLDLREGGGLASATCLAYTTITHV